MSSQLVFRAATTVCLLLLNAGAMTAARAEPIIFVVSYHNVDFAKTVCQGVLARAPDAQKRIREYQQWPADDLDTATLKAAYECKSVNDPRELGRRLENELMDALAVNPRCAGVTVIREPHQDWERSAWLDTWKANDKIKRQSDYYWDLHLDYSPFEKSYGWTLFPEKEQKGWFQSGLAQPAGSMVNGEGNTAKVATDICTVVTRRGATIR